MPISWSTRSRSGRNFATCRSSSVTLEWWNWPRLPSRGRWCWLRSGWFPECRRLVRQKLRRVSTLSWAIPACRSFLMPRGTRSVLSWGTCCQEMIEGRPCWFVQGLYSLWRVVFISGALGSWSIVRKIRHSWSTFSSHYMTARNNPSCPSCFHAGLQSAIPGRTS